MSKDNGGIQKVPEQTLSNETMLSLVAGGDCSALGDGQRLAYYRARCEAAGLDERTQPFEFIRLNGKLVLYARKAATDQLTQNRKLSVAIVREELVSGVRVITAEVKGPDGRSSQDQGAVSIEGLKGDALANALMKCVTKAKRRAVLSHCGLGILDETEIETIPTTFTAPPTPVPIPATVAAEAGEPAEQVIEHAEEVVASHDPFANAQTTAQLVAAMRKIPQGERPAIMAAYNAASERIRKAAQP